MGLGIEEEAEKRAINQQILKLAGQFEYNDDVEEDSSAVKQSMSQMSNFIDETEEDKDVEIDSKEKETVILTEEE